MDSPNGSTANSMVEADDVLENSLAVVDPSQPMGETAPMEESPPPLVEYLLPVIHDQDRQYECRYCDKKFSNKQALGGHQNAHKLDRHLQKSAPDWQDPNNFRYVANSSNAPFLVYSHVPSDFMNRPPYLSLPCASPQPEIPFGFGSRPGMPVVVENYGPRPVFSGWVPPQFSGPNSVPYMMNYGAGTSAVGAERDLFIRTVSDREGTVEALFRTSGSGPGESPGEENAVDWAKVLAEGEYDDASGMDLKLRL